MSVEELLTELADREIHLTVDNGHLKVRGPRGSLTTELRDKLSEHKETLLRLLSEQSAEEAVAVFSRDHPRPGRAIRAVSVDRYSAGVLDRGPRRDGTRGDQHSFLYRGR